MRNASALTIGPRERQFASILWRRAAAGQTLGRRDIHRITGVHPTLAGNAVANLIEAGLFRDGVPHATLERGRPQTIIEFNPDARTFLGLSISPGEVRLARLDTTGKPLSPETVQRRIKPQGLVEAAAELLRDNISPAVFSVGITVTGVVDPAGHALLFSSALPSSSPVSLEPIYIAAGDTPIVLNNDLHALSSRWTLTPGFATDATGETDVVLLVGLDDGRLGASVLIAGRPQRGSVVAANELGHTRFPIKTDRCFCGQTGCLERIVSTPQLQHFGASTNRTLDEVLGDPGADQKSLNEILEHLTNGLANAVNFVRPTQLVIASPLVRHASLTEHLKTELPDRFLSGLRPRVKTTFWQQSSIQSAENAAWLALADVFAYPDPNPEHS